MKVYKLTNTRYERYMKSFTESLVASNSLSNTEAQRVMRMLEESSPSRHEEIVREFKRRLPPGLAEKVSIQDAKENSQQMVL